MRRFVSTTRFSLFLVFVFTLKAFALPEWSYDAGPDPDENNEMQRELINLVAEMPYMPGMSYDILGKQKFRPAYGPTNWRMLLKPNSVKILFIGQDATHIAEAAGRTATAGFGGRAQDLAGYFGVNESAAFMNAYAFTIRGQYGAFDSPYFRMVDGEWKLSFEYDRKIPKEGRNRVTIVDNQLWLMTQDPESPITQWRNRLIDWIFRNNQKTLQLVVTFGQPAGDAVARFAESLGAEVGTRFEEDEIKEMQFPEIRLEYSGGNNEFPTVQTPKGDDFYEELLGAEPYYPDVAEQTAAQDALLEAFKEARTKGKRSLESFMKKIAFTKQGPYRNGIVHAGQVGGFDLNKMTVKGKATLSLQGLKLSDGQKIQNEVLVVELPHPSALSRKTPRAAAASVKAALRNFEPYKRSKKNPKGWEIKADPGMENKYALGEDYVYSRATIGPEYYDFGTPGTRMVGVSTAYRPTRPREENEPRRDYSHVIVFGSRDKAQLDWDLIDEMTEVDRPEGISDEEIFTARPISEDLRYTFDPGPGEDLARLMKENLDLDLIFTTKKGNSEPEAIEEEWEQDGIAVFNTKTHPELKDFGHYRGRFENPRVVILADPDGFDDIMTARALTGARGQYLHGLMEDMEVGHEYLVIKTVPFGMDGANEEEWATVLDKTQAYRDALFTEIVKNKGIELVLTDGEWSTQEGERLKKKFRSKWPKKMLAIERGEEKGSGIVEVGKEITKIDQFNDVDITGEMANIPREHLTYYARMWEGTSGDRVAPVGGRLQGLSFAMVVPGWALDQRPDVGAEVRKGIRKLIQILKDNGVPLPGEKLENYFDRMSEEVVRWFFPRTFEPERLAS